MARDHELWLQETSERPHRGWSFGGDGSVRHECMAWLPEGIADRKLAGFLDNHGGWVVASTAESVRMRLGKSGWRVGRARQAHNISMELQVRLHRETVCVRNMTHVTIETRPLRIKKLDETLRGRSIELVKELRGCLMAERLERRFAERTLAEFPVAMWRVDDGGRRDLSKFKVEALAHDVSASGVALLTAEAPAAAKLCLKYRDRATEDVVWATARVVRRAVDAGERHLCAARFDRTARFSRWDYRAALSPEEVYELFGNGAAAASDNSGTVASPEDTGLRPNGAHSFPRRREYTGEDSEGNAGASGNNGAAADRRAALGRCLMELQEELDNLEDRVRRHHAIWNALHQQIAQ